VLLTVLSVVATLATALCVAGASSQVAEWCDRASKSEQVRKQLDVASKEQPLRFVPEKWRALYAQATRAIDPRKKRRTQLFVHQLPDGLDQIAQALGAGLSLPQAVERSSHYMAEPIASELKKVHDHMSISHSFEQSFAQLLEVHESPQLKLVCSGIAVQSKLGGNMKKMLQRSARYCRQSQALERSLKVQTAGSRLSLKIILFTPFVLCGVLSVLMPTFAQNLLFTATGRLLLVVALALDAVGVGWAYRLMKVEL